MESWTDCCSRSLINKIVHYFTGSAYENFSVIKVNSENLAVNGELHFINSFNTWKNFVVCDRNCATILQHFIHTHDSKRDHTDADVSEEVFKQLISKSSDWSVRIKKCSLQKEKVCLYLNRADVITNVKIAIRCNKTFGKVDANNKVFDLKYQSDIQSNLTTQRLHLMRNITAKVLDLHGYRVSGENCVGKYIFTTKSEGLIEEGYEKYVCGVVKNLKSNTKEIHLTWEQCLKDRIDYVNNNFQSMFDNFEEGEHDTEKYVILHNMAHAIMVFELMSIKPSRSIVIENDNFKSNRHITNTRGALFVLYNTARIARIIAEYNLKVSCGDFPPLPNIDDVDFSQLHQEEEWELIYNFIFGYPQMLQNCLRCEPNFQIYPQMICLFLSRLCQKFSSYYRRIKILTRGSVHLAPKMFARLYMLYALQVVLENALDILDIKPVSQM